MRPVPQGLRNGLRFSAILPDVEARVATSSAGASEWAGLPRRGSPLWRPARARRPDGRTRVSDDERSPPRRWRARIGTVAGSEPPLWKCDSGPPPGRHHDPPLDTSARRLLRETRGLSTLGTCLLARKLFDNPDLKARTARPPLAVRKSLCEGSFRSGSLDRHTFRSLLDNYLSRRDAKSLTPRPLGATAVFHGLTAVATLKRGVDQDGELLQPRLPRLTAVATLKRRLDLADLPGRAPSFTASPPWPR